jgi:hypothetical protein
LPDRRPPRYRCPAVPGLKNSARAILTVPGSSVLPSEISYLPSGTAYCTAACGSAALRQPARRPSCVCTGSGPRWRTSRCARPQPTPSPRCCSLTSLPPGSSSLPGLTVSGLREKLYPCNLPMSSPATTDFATFEAEVICSEPAGGNLPREDPALSPRHSLRVHAAPCSAGRARPGRPPPWPVTGVRHRHSAPVLADRTTRPRTTRCSPPGQPRDQSPRPATRAVPASSDAPARDTSPWPSQDTVILGPRTASFA